MNQPNSETASPAPKVAAVGLHAVVRRRWLYEVTDWNDDSSYVDENGSEVCRDDAKEHITTDAEAAIEADRRADLWETKQDALVARVTRHSQGKISEPSNDALYDSHEN